MESAVRSVLAPVLVSWMGSSTKVFAIASRANEPLKFSAVQRAGSHWSGTCVLDLCSTSALRPPPVTT